MFEFAVRKRSSVLALSPERLGRRLGSDINCDRSFTMAKASASRPAGLVICGEWVSQLGLYTLKSLFASLRPYLGIDKSKLLLLAVVLSDFSHCPLIWLFCSKTTKLLELTSMH